MEENKELIENNEAAENAEEAETAEENTEVSGEEAPAEEKADAGEKADPEDKAGEDADDEEEGSMLRDVIEIVESTLVTVFVIVMIFTYILHPVNIVGRSMVPTLNGSYNGAREEKKDTDKVFMSTVFGKVRYGDILVIDKKVNYLLDENGEAYVPDTDPPINECIIKRVIACEGQTIDIRDGQVIVDGKTISEPYIADGSSNLDLGAFTGQFPITIPKGYYFVMGDNRDHSTDSRHKSVGLVKKDQIYGKAIIKYHPFSEFDILTNSWKGK